MDSRYCNCICWLGVSKLHITDGKASGQWEITLIEGFEAILQQLRTSLTLRPPIEYAEQVQDTSCRRREGLVTEQIGGKRRDGRHRSTSDPKSYETCLFGGIQVPDDCQTKGPTGRGGVKRV